MRSVNFFCNSEHISKRLRHVLSTQPRIPEGYFRGRIGVSCIIVIRYYITYTCLLLQFYCSNYVRSVTVKLIVLRNVRFTRQLYCMEPKQKSKRNKAKSDLLEVTVRTTVRRGSPRGGRESMESLFLVSDNSLHTFLSYAVIHCVTPRNVTNVHEPTI